jgi:hypothetical protein
VKVGDHIIQVTQFKYLEFIIQNDGEIKAYENIVFKLDGLNEEEPQVFYVIQMYRLS